MPAYCDPVKDVGASALTKYEAVDVGPKEAVAILDEIEPPLVRCLVILLSVTGLRPSEALALKWSDLDFEDGNFVVVRGFVDGISAIRSPSRAGTGWRCTSRWAQ